MPIAAAPPWVGPSAEAVVAALGLSLPAAALRIEPRGDKFAAFLPDHRIAWFPTSDAGAERLEREARVLELIARHCSFATPRLLERGPNWQLRQSVPGEVAPWARYRRLQQDPEFARNLGTQLGTMLADQHLSIPAPSLTGRLPQRPSWPYPYETIAADLPQVAPDDLLPQALEVIRRYETTCADTIAPVLVHSDLGLHNLAFAPDDAVAGIFDYADAAFADRHHDFRYLLFDTTDDTLLTSAIAAYRAAGGAPIDRQRWPSSTPLRPSAFSPSAVAPVLATGPPAELSLRTSPGLGWPSSGSTKQEPAPRPLTFVPSCNI